ncbi:flavodoxin family protein [Bdellovibrio bacteriovorus]|uniref:flavodoxin family protein n=1 Tax=Bdellovibrio bacteriovorus TaxID=959 RepID=UPI0035A66844
MAILLIIPLLISVVSVAIPSIEYYQLKKNEEVLTKDTRPKADAQTAVIYFSRSGNTALMAQKIAAILNADLIEIKADDYKIGPVGLVKAAMDARNHTAHIHPEKVDLSKYSKIFLGSPIWLYSPAPPIWAFARNHRFDGKDVILFNTGNSKMEQRFIDEFKEVAMKNGAQSFDHKAIIRGRMTRQISPEELLKQVEDMFM